MKTSGNAPEEADAPAAAEADATPSPQGRDKKDDGKVGGYADSDKESGRGFQEPKLVACIHGGSQTPHSN